MPYPGTIRGRAGRARATPSPRGTGQAPAPCVVLASIVRSKFEPRPIAPRSSARQPRERHVRRSASSNPPAPITAKKTASASIKTNASVIRIVSRASSRAIHTKSGVLDGREPDHGHGVRAADVPVVELAEEVRHLFGAADRRVVVLDLAW